jgi:hypothetical protein
LARLFLLCSILLYHSGWRRYDTRNQLIAHPDDRVLNPRGIGGHPKVSSKGRIEDMAAFCACCGAEITLKAEACPVCGTPRHGMLPPDLQPALDVDSKLGQEEGPNSRKLRRPRL